MFKIYDYKKDFFWKKKDKNGVTKYYFKINNNLIEVSKEIYKVCQSSYNKIRYDMKRKVAKSISSYENIDDATFFVVDRPIDKDIVHEIYIKDMSNLIKKEILLLPIRQRNIAFCIFINELSDSETARLLHIPQTTVSYQKKIIRKKIQEKLKIFAR